MFNLFKSLFKINIYKNEKYYEKIKQLTILLRKTKIMRGIGKTIIDEPYYEFTTTINSIYVNVHAKAYPDSKVRITMKIGEQNYSIEDDSNDKSINSFNENIKVIFIDTIDKTIELLQDKVTKIQDEKNIKDTINSLENKDSFKSTEKVINLEKEEDYYTQKLKFAIKNLDVKLIKTLIKNVLNVDIQDDDNNNTSLIVAVKNFDLKLIKLLIEKDANQNIVNNNGETALSIAKKRGYKKIIDLLDNKNDFKSKEIKNIIDINMALKSKDFDLVIELIKRREEIDKKDENGNTPLMNIVRANNISNKFKQYEMIDLLLEKGADVYIKNNYNFNILEIMKYKEYYNEIRKIFEKYNYFKNTKKIKDEIITFDNSCAIEDNKVDSFSENLALAVAINKFNIKEIKTLIESGANVDTQDSDNNTSLIVAVKNIVNNNKETTKSFDLELIKLLIEKGANKNIVNNKGETALSIAKKRGYKKIIDLLDNKNDSQKKENLSMNMLLNKKLTDVEKINKYLKDDDFDKFKSIFDFIDINSDEVFSILKESIKENKENYLKYLISDFNVNDMLKRYFNYYTLRLLEYCLEINNNNFFKILKDEVNEQFTSNDTKEFLEKIYRRYKGEYKTCYYLLENKLNNEDKNYLEFMQNININLEEFYKKIKQLTVLLKQTEIIRGSYKIGRKTIYYSYYEFTTTINSIYVNVNINVDVSADSYLSSELSITIKIGEQNYSIEDGSNGKSINSFNENIKVIFIDTIDKTIELLQDKVTKIQDEKNIKDTQQKTLIEKLAQDINNQASLKKENLVTTILSDNSQKDTNNEYSKKEETLQATIEMQSNEILKLQNKLLKEEEDVKELINNFTSKINSLEEKIKKQKVVKTITPLLIPVEKPTINKTDGELIKRDSFDDF